MTNAQPPVVSQSDREAASSWLTGAFGAVTFAQTQSLACLLARHHLDSSGAVDREAIAAIIDSGWFRTDGRRARVLEKVDAILALSTSKAATSDEVVPDELAARRRAQAVERLQGWLKAPLVVAIAGPVLTAPMQEALEVLLAAAPTPPASDEGAFPAGMVAWAGGKGPPQDWDESADVVTRDGRVRRSPGLGLAISWRHVGDDLDIIAYTPAATGAGESVEAMRERCAKVAEDAVAEVYPTDHAGRSMLALAASTAATIRALPLTTNQGGQS